MEHGPQDEGNRSVHPTICRACLTPGLLKANPPSDGPPRFGFLFCFVELFQRASVTTVYNVLYDSVVGSRAVACGILETPLTTP